MWPGPKRVPIVPLCNNLSLIICALWAHQGGWAVMLLLSIGTTTTTYGPTPLQASPLCRTHTHRHTHSLGLCNYFMHCSRIVRLLFAQKCSLCVEKDGKVLPGDLRWPGGNGNNTKAWSARKTIDQSLMVWWANGRGVMAVTRITHQFTRCGAGYLMIFHSHWKSNRLAIFQSVQRR